MKVFITVLTVMVVLLLGFVGFIYSGLYNVAASEPHAGLVRWVMETTAEKSIQSRAKGLDVPVMDEGTVLNTGLRHFHEMCVSCHGAPGVKSSEIGMGLNPAPPELGHSAEEWSTTELYWIIKNGIRMTGMPAFGTTHSDQELWAIVHFLERLPEISPNEYQNLLASIGLTSSSSSLSHEHDHESHEH